MQNQETKQSFDRINRHALFLQETNKLRQFDRFLHNKTYLHN